MATKQKGKSSSKPRARNRKAEPPAERLDQVQSPKLDPEMEEQIVPDVAAIQAVAEPALADAVAVDEVAPAELVPSRVTAVVNHPSTTEMMPVISSAIESAAPPVKPTATTDHVSIGIQSIANAYKAYASKSLEQTGSLVEKLMSVRSFDKAAEIQIEFARQTYANLIAESQNICGLYSRLTGQMFRSWQGFAMGTPAK